MIRCAAWILFLALACVKATAQTQTSVDFANDVLPLLKTHCIDCHGPENAEAQLRLDTIESALRGGDSGEPAVVPGESDKSYLIARITDASDQHRMPPDAEPLPADSVQLLRNWINDAALWKNAIASLEAKSIDHWSFQPVSRPPTTAGKSTQAIDLFIDQRLEESKLARSPSASRSELIRRLYLVMHGLPPTPVQVAAFVNDDREDSWALLVEEVMASPRYGERFATLWLDLVRFGETTGFETNRERPNAWPYRDWVVEALNNDKPYDQFIIEQLAGDAMGADVATGFLVGGPNDIVKGSDVQLGLMQRQDEFADMINTTGTAFLGMTIGCARCHNHKFDPITQSDYYALQAVFAGVNHGERALPLAPKALAEMELLDEQISRLRRGLEKFIRRPKLASARDDGSTSNASAQDASAPSALTQADTTEVETAKAARIESLRDAVKPAENIESFTPRDAKFVRFTILATNQSEPCIDELEIFAKERNVALAEVGAKVSSSGNFEHPLHQLPHINDGAFGNAKSWIASTITGSWVQIELPAIQAIDRIVWARDRNGQFGDRLATAYEIESSIDAKSWTVVASSADRQAMESAPQSASIAYDFDSFPSEAAASGRTQFAELNGLVGRRDVLSKSTMVYAGAFSQPGPIHRLYRGEPSAPREEVDPSAIASLTDLKLASDTPEQQRRLAVAKWIADKNNPLTARVMVNRLWQFHFGVGFVDTPSDFGGNGTMPSHPELLDWLAAEFMESGWSIKHLLRLILLSQTWQQDSRPSEAAIAIDAGSRLMWRFPPRRLDAEGIRDCMLAVTGKLDLTQGGPGFSAFEVEMENVRHYFPKTSFGPVDWRRMIYMTRVRQERESVFGVFDCPDFSQVVPKRSRSTTPLQALNLLNSEFVMQQADLMIERLNDEAQSPQEKVRLAYELCFSRPAEPAEMDAALAFIEQTDWQQFARAILNSNEFVFIP